ncbi:Odorant receptor Or1 [Anthophora retusa]
MARVSSHEWMKSFRQLIHLQISYLKYSGLWKIETRHLLLTKIAYFVYKLWMLTMMHVFSITVFADIYENFDNLSIITDDGCIFAGIVVVIFKAINYQIRRKRIIKLLDDVLNCADDLCRFSNMESIKVIINRYHVLNKVIFHGFSMLGCILGIALLFFSPMETGLPIRAKYPFNTTVSPWREIGFIVETSAVSGGLLGIIAMDSVTVIVCSLITALFDILNAIFEKCTSETDMSNVHINSSSLTPCRIDEICNMNTNTRTKNKKQDDTFLRRYKICLQFHQRLVFMTNDYNRIYSSSMFVQMLSSTSIICLTGFQAVVVGGQSSDIMKFGIYLSAAVSQLLYICWIGNELSYASSVTERSQWLSGWNQENLTDIVKIFTLSVMFTRKLVTLKAGVFYILSLETFIVIVRRSYSVFTLLNNMHSANP